MKYLTQVLQNTTVRKLLYSSIIWNVISSHYRHLLHWNFLRTISTMKEQNLWHKYSRITLWGKVCLILLYYFFFHSNSDTHYTQSFVESNRLWRNEIFDSSITRYHSEKAIFCSTLWHLISFQYRHSLLSTFLTMESVQKKQNAWLNYLIITL